MKYELLSARNLIEKYFGVNLEEKGRQRDKVQARQFYYKWGREHTIASYKYLSLTLPRLRQDHATIINAINKFDSYYATGKQYAKSCLNLCGRIASANKPAYNEDELILNAS